MLECLTKQAPYGDLEGVQAALAVMVQGLRPEVPADAHPRLGALIRACWAPVPEQRPDVSGVVAELEAILADEEAAAEAGTAAAAARAAAAAGASGEGGSGAGPEEQTESMRVSDAV